MTFYVFFQSQGTYTTFEATPTGQGGQFPAKSLNQWFVLLQMSVQLISLEVQKSHFWYSNSV